MCTGKSGCGASYDVSNDGGMSLGVKVIGTVQGFVSGVAWRGGHSSVVGL